MFSYTTTNAIYESNAIANKLIKISKTTGKQIKMDKVIPVKVQRAYDQWLETLNTPELDKFITDTSNYDWEIDKDFDIDNHIFQTSFVVNVIKEICKDYKQLELIKDIKFIETLTYDEIIEMFEAYNQTNNFSNQKIADIFLQYGILGVKTKNDLGQWEMKSFSEYESEQAEQTKKILAKFKVEQSRVLTDQESTPKKTNVTCSDVKSSVDVSVALSDKEIESRYEDRLKSTQYFFDIVPANSQEQAEIDQFIKAYREQETPIDDGKIYCNLSTHGRFYVETESGIVYQAFREDDQTHCVIILDDNISSRPFATPMRDDLMRGELLEAFDQWFNQTFSQEQSKTNEIIIGQDTGFEGAEPMAMTFDGSNYSIKPNSRQERIQSQSIQRIKDRMQTSPKGFFLRYLPMFAFVFAGIVLVIALGVLFAHLGF